ncbi:hypothetical protein [Thalassotalea ganghwensis]
MNRNIFLLSGALATMLAAFAHLGCIVFGAQWYRTLGAGEQLALLAEQGHWYPTAITLVISIILIVWSLVALSAAGVIIRLPLLRTALCLIMTIFLLRGSLFFLLMPLFPENSMTFWLISSAICLMIGMLYGIGTKQVWSQLK